MSEYSFNTSQIKEMSPKLRAGDRVLLSGTVYTSRDAAHKRIMALLDSGEKLPYELDGAVPLPRECSIWDSALWSARADARKKSVKPYAGTNRCIFALSEALERLPQNALPPAR